MPVLDNFIYLDENKYLTKEKEAYEGLILIDLNTSKTLQHIPKAKICDEGLAIDPKNKHMYYIKKDK